MGEDPEYAVVDGVHVAYRTFGRGGGHDLVMVAGQFFATEQLLEDRVVRRFIDGLAELGRLVVFDKRGVGLSDPFDDWSRPPHEQWADDLVAVIRSAGLDRPSVVSWDSFGIGRQAAADHPDVIGRLVLINPVGAASEVLAAVSDAPSREGFDTDPLERRAFPSRIDDPDFRDWMRRAGRTGASPRVASRLWAAQLDRSERFTPPGIRCPTLVLHRAGCVQPTRYVQAVAEEIDDSRFVQVDGVDVYPIAGDVDPLLTEISRFVTGTSVELPPERLAAAVLFTDLVSSTDRAVDLGDDRWRRLLDGHDGEVRSCIEQVGGRVVKFTGDGALAIMPSTRAAVAAAHSIRNRVARLGLEIRAGVHLGDVDRRDDDVSGIAVNIAARIMHEAEPGEILVSDPARRALIGGGAAFEPARTVELKGIPDRWPLHPSTAP